MHSDNYHHIYLSPHLDDAALSCGGQIARHTAAGRPVLIVTLMAGDPPPGAVAGYAAELHHRWQLAQDAVAARRAEDVAACAILGADYRHGTIPDCIYRRDADGRSYYETWAQITGEIHQADYDLKQQIRRQLAALLAPLPPAQQVVAPLAAGNHVDHQLVRQAAEAVLGTKLVYYEDYPYVRDATTLERALAGAANTWQSEVIRLTPAAVQQKIEAIAAYNSQLSTFFNGRDDLERQVWAFTNHTGGERLWQRHSMSNA